MIPNGDHKKHEHKRPNRDDQNATVEDGGNATVSRSGIGVLKVENAAMIAGEKVVEKGDKIVWVERMEQNETPDGSC